MYLFFHVKNNYYTHICIHNVYTRASLGVVALSGCEGTDFTTLSGGRQRCMDDIIGHASCDMPCDVNWPMNVGDTHSISSWSDLYSHCSIVWLVRPSHLYTGVWKERDGLAAVTISLHPHIIKLALLVQSTLQQPS